MKDKTLKIVLISIIVVIIGFIIGAIIVASNKNKEIEEMDVLEPTIVNEYGAIMIDKAGVNTEGNTDELTELHLYFDPICPGCGYIDRTLSPTFNKLVDNEEVVMFLTPLSFLDRASSDDYSSRAVSAMITVGEGAPDKLMPFINKVFLNQPEEGPNYDSVSNQDFVSMAMEVGVPNDVAELIPQELYKDWAIKNSSNVSKTQKDVFPNGVSTPALFINLRDDNGKVVGKLLDFETDLPLDEYIIEEVRTS